MDFLICKTLNDASVKIRSYICNERPLNLREMENIANVIDEAIGIGKQLVQQPHATRNSFAQLLWLKFKNILGGTVY